jgi:prepilin-type processing-associated H-X9-DG protein/prepilin-type N-terminal cleavage/methylation domain-containing protein
MKCKSNRRVGEARKPIRPQGFSRLPHTPSALSLPLNPPGGFSLVELLIVISIIALLIGLLLPALGRARESARGIQCLSNLRQMAIAAQAYVSVNRGYYPPAYFSATNGSETVAYSWDFTSVSDGAATRVIPGLLWQNNDPTQIQQCPSFDGSSNSPGDPYTGYNYNTSFIGHGQGEAFPVPLFDPTPAKASSIRHPSGVAMFGDGQWALGADKYMRAPFANPGDALFTGRFAGTQGFRHQGKTNVAFCDGHAESLEKRYTDNADGADNVTAGTGFLSKDNSVYGAR